MNVIKRTLICGYLKSAIMTRTEKMRPGREKKEEVEREGEEGGWGKSRGEIITSRP